MDGTVLYNKEKKVINPVSHASVINSEANSSYTNVEDNLLNIWKAISEESGDAEASKTIKIEIFYCKTYITDKNEIKEAENWLSDFTFPDEENPYIWKKTIISYAGDSLKLNTTYEIVTADTSLIILTIYTRTESMTTKPTIEYKLKVDSEGNPLYIDSDGGETTLVTETKAYDYNFYYNGEPANGLNRLPPTPEGLSYTWTDYPQDISLSYTAVFMSRRLRLNGVWGPFSTPVQFGQWPIKD